MSTQVNRSPSAQEWTDHEHVAAPLELEARKFLQAAGAPEIARRALEAATESAPNESLSNGPLSSAQDKAENLALKLGFRSYRSLLEASTPGLNSGSHQWFVTVSGDGEWILWNDREFEILGAFDSKEHALAAIQ